jgi:predicted  nucleic acid-binding Zn-ribbon protein
MDYFQNDPVSQQALSDAQVTITDLRQQVATLQMSLDAARDQSVSTAESAKRVIDLQNEKQVLQQSLDAMQTQLSFLQTDNEKLRLELQAGAQYKDGDAATVRANQLEEANRQLAADFLELQDKSSATIKDLNAKIVQLEDGLQNAKAANQAREAAQKQTDLTAAAAADVRAKALNAQIAQLQDTLAATKQDLEDTRAKLQDAVAAQAASQQPLAENAVPDPAPATVTKSRNPELVSQSLATATGAQALTPEQTSDLASRLIQGDCVGESLKATMGRVPVLLLRDLIRDLNSDC